MLWLCAGHKAEVLQGWLGVGLVGCGTKLCGSRPSAATRQRKNASPAASAGYVSVSCGWVQAGLARAGGSSWRATYEAGNSQQWIAQHSLPACQQQPAALLLATPTLFHTVMDAQAHTATQVLAMTAALSTGGQHRLRACYGCRQEGQQSLLAAQQVPAKLFVLCNVKRALLLAAVAAGCTDHSQHAGAIQV